MNPGTPPQKECEVLDFGRLEYRQASEVQGRLAGEIAAGDRPPALLLLEHPAVYTFGRIGNPKNLLWGEEELARRGIAVFQSDRGGDVTYHGPGQLVGYPILPLAGLGWRSGSIPKADYVGYIRRLERVLILALNDFGIPAQARRGFTGVWVDPDFWRERHPEKDQPAKIASIGVKVDARGITRHGFGLNIDTDPEHWLGILACGLEGVAMANMSEVIHPPPAMIAVKKAVGHAFGEVMDFRMTGALVE